MTSSGSPARLPTAPCCCSRSQAPGRPKVSSAGLVRATLAAASTLPDAAVVAVPLASRGDATADHTLGQRVVAAYAPGDVLGVTGEGELPDEVADLVDRDRPGPDEQGLVVFFTGLSGSGKSTLARALHDTILERGERTVTSLDGDVVRRNLSAGLTFSKADRETNIRRIGWVAAEIARHRGVAICSPIAPFDGTRQQVRAMVEEAGGAFVLVHVATPLEECERRDRKGLYAKARRGEIPEFTGISSPYEEPEDAAVRVDTTGRTIEDALAEIIAVLQPYRLVEAVPGPDPTQCREPTSREPSPYRRCTVTDLLTTSALSILLVSFGVGIVVGLTGMGGGALMTPALIFLGVNPTVAVANDLVAASVNKSVGAAVHWRLGKPNLRLAGLLMCASVPTAFAGAFIVNAVGSVADQQDFLKQALGAALLFTAATYALRMYLQLRHVTGGNALAEHDPQLKPALTLLVGAVGGLLVGITSVGSGSLIMVALLLLYPTLSAVRLVGTDLVQAVPLVLSAAISHVLVSGWSGPCSSPSSSAAPRHVHRREDGQLGVPVGDPPRHSHRAQPDRAEHGGRASARSSASSAPRCCCSGRWRGVPAPDPRPARLRQQRRGVAFPERA